MVKYRILAGLFIGFFAAQAAEAANISVLILELGQNREPGNQYSILWENGLMDAFFDSGHIVSNSPIIQIEETPDGDFPAEAERDFGVARAGGMDFFLIALIDYSTPTVSLRLFDIKSAKMVLEQKYVVTTLRNTKDESDKIKTAAMTMAARVR